MPSLHKACALAIVAVVLASPGVGQEVLTPPIPYPDGTGLVDRRVEPTAKRVAMGPAPFALVGLGLARTAPLGNDLVRLDSKLEFRLGPGSALLVNQPYGLKSGRSVSAKVISLFPVLSRDVPLSKGSDVVNIVASDGTVLFARYRGIPNSIDAYQQKVSAQTAADVARRDFMRIARTDDVNASDPVREIWVNPDLQGRLAWRLMVSNSNLDAPVAVEYWVSALDREILRRENALYAFEGQATADVWTGSAFQAQATEPRGLQRIQLTSATASAITEGSGRFNTPGTGDVTFKGGLAGPTSVIKPKAGTPLVASASGTHASPITVHFAATQEFALAQTSAYYWINVGRDFASSILDPIEPRLAQLSVFVNGNNHCNAYWKHDRAGPFAIFYRAGGGCPNTAYSDVVLHEMGHGIDEMNLEVVDMAYSEGFGDAIAMLVTRQSCFGREFNGQGTCKRDASVVVQWPLPAGSTDHQKGRVYGGFVWELLQRLTSSTSARDAESITKQLVLSVAKMNPSSIPMAIEYTFVADDDDTNLATCSRHQQEISAAAVSRGLLGHAACTKP